MMSWALGWSCCIEYGRWGFLLELIVFKFCEHRLNEYCVVKMSEHLAKLQIKIY